MTEDDIKTGKKIMGGPAAAQGGACCLASLQSILRARTLTCVCTHACTDTYTHVRAHTHIHAVTQSHTHHTNSLAHPHTLCPCSWRRSGWRATPSGSLSLSWWSAQSERALSMLNKRFHRMMVPVGKSCSEGASALLPRSCACLPKTCLSLHFPRRPARTFNHPVHYASHLCCHAL